MLSVIFKGIIFLVLMLIFFSNNVSIIRLGNAYSNMHIAFALFLAIIASCKYNALKYYLESKTKHKYAFCIAIIILFFIAFNLFYAFLPQDYEIHNWLLSEYNHNMVDAQTRDFTYLPIYYNSLNILSMTSFEMIFSLLLIAVAYIREKAKIGEMSYFLERTLKSVFRYNLLIVFLIYILTIPSGIVDVIKIIGIIALLLWIIFESIKTYLAIKSCRIKNKEKYGKDNLIVVMTTTNINFSLSDYLLNPLHIFYRFDNKNIFKPLVVSGKSYTFVSNDAIRCGLLDINQFNDNIAYIFMINADLLLIDTKRYEYAKKIEEISSQTKKFLIYTKDAFFFKPVILRNIENKYSFKVKNKVYLKDILDVVHIKPNADELKLKVKALLEFIKDKELDNYIKEEYEAGRIKKEDIESKKHTLYELIHAIPLDKEDALKIEKQTKFIEEEKNTYLKYGVEQILNSFNYMEYFYTLLKMSEYVIHYMGLKSILEESNEDIKIDSVKFGTWRELLDFNKEYSSRDTKKIEKIVSLNDIANSIIEINKIAKNNNKEICLEDKFYFKDVCKAIGTIRNRMLVHGAISYKTAENTVDYLFNLLFLLVKEFEELNITIEDDEKIKNIFEKDISAVYRYSNKMFLYSNSVLEDKKVIYNECINYETGKKKVIDGKACFNIDIRYSMEQIKEKLGKWMWDVK